MFRKLWINENLDKNSSYSTKPSPPIIYSTKAYIQQSVQLPIQSPIETPVDVNVQAHINFCKSATLDSLISAQNSCGWIYKKNSDPTIAKPDISQGALGTVRGPIGEKLPPGAKWFWNISAARNEIEKDLCKTMTACKDLKKIEYAGTCSWNPSEEKGVATRLVKNTDDYITKAQQCKRKIPSFLKAEETEKEKEKETETEIDTIELVLDQPPQAHKKNLIQPFFFWADPLTLSTYEEGAAASSLVINHTKKEHAKMCKPDAMLSHMAEISAGRNEFEQYDFCLELKDLSRAPFELACLQKFFFKMGGHQNNPIYPTINNLPIYNQMLTWLNVKNYILHNIKISPRPAEPKSIFPIMNGVEIFWIDLATDTFIERMILPSFKKMPSAAIKNIRVAFISYLKINSTAPYKFSQADAVISKNGENNISIYWEQFLGESVNLQINDEFLSLTQESTAPFWSFECYIRPDQYGEKEVVFCEKRLANKFTFYGSGYGYTEIANKYYLYFTGTQHAIFSKKIAISAIGTVTALVYFDDLPSFSADVFSVSSLGISLKKMPGGYHSFISKKGGIPFGEPVKKFTWYFLTIRLNKSAGTLTFAAIPYSAKYVEASVLFSKKHSTTFQTNISFAHFTYDGANKGELTLGGVTTFAWIHFFDYEIIEDGLLNKEIKQTWLSAWV